MANPKYEKWLEPDGLIKIAGWARDGLTEAQIAKNMGIGMSTLSAWKLKHKEIVDALKKGKEVVDFEVENALLTKALSGDVTACIFWLKNRRKDKWRDKPDTSVSEHEKTNLMDAIVCALQKAGGDSDDVQ